MTRMIQIVIIVKFMRYAVTPCRCWEMGSAEVVIVRVAFSDHHDVVGSD
jgi:hypothetical protein